MRTVEHREPNALCGMQGEHPIAVCGECVSESITVREEYLPLGFRMMHLGGNESPATAKAPAAPTFERVIYISGKMSGLPEHNYPAFNQAEKDLRKRFPDAKVLNPARNFGGDQGRGRRAYYAADFAMLTEEANSIYLLNGWQGSEGAMIEFSIARSLEMDFALEYDGGDGQMDGAGRPIWHSADEWPQYAPVAYEAHRLVFGDRGHAYGHPSKNFDDISAVWSAHLETAVSPADVANMMTMLKMVRDRAKYKRDNVIDAIGYQIARQRVEDGL